MSALNPKLHVGNDKDCDIYQQFRLRNRGGFFGLEGVNGYEGIPQNLVLNIIGWSFMILIFSLIRKNLWNYGRIALVHRNENKRRSIWTEIFHSRNPGRERVRILTGAFRNKFLPLGKKKSKVDLARGNPDGNSDDSLPTLHQLTGEDPDDVDRFEFGADGTLIKDTGYFSWIKIALTLTDEQMLEKCGNDCLLYLSFQRHLILLASIITVPSMLIILPINHLGTAADDQTYDMTEFGQTIIMNLKHIPRLLWVHVILAVSFLFVTIPIMRNFSRGLKLLSHDPVEARTVMIVGINREYCFEDRLRKHFRKIYPFIDVQELSLAYDIAELQKVDILRQGARTAKIYWEEHSVKHNYEPTMRPYPCGAVCCCLERCCCPAANAIDYYATQEDLFIFESDYERDRALKRPLGIAFVTFDAPVLAERVLRDYRLTNRLLELTPASKFSRRLMSDQWTVTFAPLPDDLYWENLTYGVKAWYIKAFVVNVTLALIISIYTTPAFILYTVSPILTSTGITNHNLTVLPPGETPSTLTGLLLNTLPTLLIWIGAVTLPSLVSVSDQFVGFWTKTAEIRSRMIKVFSFLLFMVVILPSIGVSSVIGLLERAKPEFGFDWECIFSKDNGALFVNYVCTSTFLGTGSELLRLPELFIYAIKLCFSKSAAELSVIRKSILWEFQIGSQYAWMMLNFAIFSIFSVIFPLITPFGLLYLIMKHFVDRYNVYFAYAPATVQKEVHATAIHFVIICMFLLQLNLLAYVTTQTMDPRKEPRGLRLFTVVAFAFCICLFAFQYYFRICLNFSPVLYRRVERKVKNPDEEAEDWLSRSVSNMECGPNPTSEPDKSSSDSDSEEDFFDVPSRKGPSVGDLYTDEYRQRTYYPKILFPDLDQLKAMLPTNTPTSSILSFIVSEDEDLEVHRKRRASKKKSKKLKKSGASTPVMDQPHPALVPKEATTSIYPVSIK